MIRLAESADAQALLDIYRYYVENTPYIWCMPSLAEFCQRIENISSRYPYLVCGGRRKHYGVCVCCPI
ncbi:MAG: N-acetyltransferase family protein [Eubacterium sp.]